MSPFLLPDYPELFSLSGAEKRALMYISHAPEHYEVERTILRALAYAVASKSSDVHFNAVPLNGKLCVFVNIRTKGGFVNHAFQNNECDATHFQTKLLQLTNNTIGGTQAEIISTRFSLDFPDWWAKAQGLKLIDAGTYKIDIRVQFQKTFGGFSIICRILDQQCTPKLSQLGLGRILEHEIRRVIREPSGLVLVSGPTGSGKTTLLNAMLVELNDGSRSIFTIENPVEFRLHGKGPITQIQTHGQVTFAAGLKSALRCDPDVILIGEIRDSETVEVALQAAQTGHLVLATIHASNAAQTISRMLDLTLDKERDALRVADTLKLVLAQRLIERYDSSLCERSLTHAEMDWMQLNGIHQLPSFFETTARIKTGASALIEAICVDHLVKQVIRSPNFNVEDIYRVAKNQLQYETLVMCGVRCVECGEALLHDCLVKLDSQPQAGIDPPIRSKFASLYGLSYKEVARVLDTYFSLDIHRSQGDIDHALEFVGDWGEDWGEDSEGRIDTAQRGDSTRQAPAPPNTAVSALRGLLLQARSAAP